MNAHILHFEREGGIRSTDSRASIASGQPYHGQPLALGNSWSAVKSLYVGADHLSNKQRKHKETSNETSVSLNAFALVHDHIPQSGLFRALSDRRLHTEPFHASRRLTTTLLMQLTALHCCEAMKEHKQKYSNEVENKFIMQNPSYRL